MIVELEIHNTQRTIIDLNLYLDDLRKNYPQKALAHIETFKSVIQIYETKLKELYDMGERTDRNPPNL